MRNNKKRGFTLVELLVVIAILAILATVSVVGYTSFIERADVSVDEQLAAQLNTFLTAVKADSTGEFYDDINENGINEDNIWAITQYILEDCGLDGELIPNSVKRGYHFFFDFEAGEYVVKKGTDLDPSWATNLLIRVGARDDVKGNTPGNLINERYFLVDTDGTDLAKAIRGFYTLEGFEGETDAAKFAGFVSTLNGLNESYKAKYLALANEIVFVTSEGNFVLANTTHSQLYIYGDATAIYNSKQIVDANGEVTDTLYLDASTPMITVSENTTIVVPNGVLVPAYALNVVAAEGKTAQIEIMADSWDEAKAYFDAEFTNPDVVVILNGKQYYVDGRYVYNLAEKEIATPEIAVAILGNNTNFVLYDFKLEINEKENKVRNELDANGDAANTGYVALDIEDGIVFNFIDINKEAGQPASRPNVAWTIDSIKLAGYTLKATVAEHKAIIDLVVTQSGNTVVFNKGTLTIDTKDTATTDDDVLTYEQDIDGLLPAVDEIVVTATSNTAYTKTGEDGVETTDYATCTYTAKVVRITGITLKLGGDDLINDNLGRLVTNGSSFSIENTVTYNHALDDVKCDIDFVIEYACDHIENGNHTNDCCGHIHVSDENDPNYCGAICLHKGTCEKGDDCWSCGHVHGENDYYDCNHDHDDLGEYCYAGGPCSHVSGGNHELTDDNTSSCLDCPHMNGDHGGYKENPTNPKANGGLGERECCGHYHIDTDNYKKCLECNFSKTHTCTTEYGCTYVPPIPYVNPNGGWICKHLTESCTDECCGHTECTDECCVHITGTFGVYPHTDDCYTCTHQHDKNDCVNTDRCTHYDGGEHGLDCCGHRCDEADAVYENAGDCLTCLHKCSDSEECMSNDCEHVHHLESECTTEGCTLTHCTINCTHENKDAVLENVDGVWKFTPRGECDGILTVTIGDLYTRSDIIIEFFDSFELDAKDQIKYLGNSNTIDIEDLFGGDIPKDATIYIFKSVATIVQDGEIKDDYMTPNRVLLANAQDKVDFGDQITFWVDRNAIKYDETNGWGTIQFYGTRTEEIYIAVVVEGEVNNGTLVAGKRISEDVVAQVIEGKNVTTYSELANTGVNILLNDIKMPKVSESAYSLTNGILYGNCYTFDITDGTIGPDNPNGYGIIKLDNSKMYDTRVIGALYPEVAISAPEAYGSNAVHTVGICWIENCYIANTRAPLSVGNENTTDATKDVTTVKDTVLYGGRYANIDLRDGTLKFEGKVYTINQPHNEDATSEDKYVGLGVVVWIESNADTNIQGLANLVQYNFVSAEYKDSFPTISVKHQKIYDLGLSSIDFPTTTMVNAILTNDQYAKFRFEANDTTYMNAGIISISGDEMDINILGYSLGTIDLAAMIGKEPGDRTGFGGTAPSGTYYQYDTYQYAVDFYIYGMLNGRTTEDHVECDCEADADGNVVCSNKDHCASDCVHDGEDLLAKSHGAEEYFSPWETEDHVAYDFVNGSIIPAQDNNYYFAYPEN